MVVAPAAPVVYAVAPDTPERTLKFLGMKAFGSGADVLPFLSRHEARAVRLVCTYFREAVDRRAWPVHAGEVLAIGNCVVVRVCVYV